jgi:hypothetical protein
MGIDEQQDRAALALHLELALSKLSQAILLADPSQRTRLLAHQLLIVADGANCNFNKRSTPKARERERGGGTLRAKQRQIEREEAKGKSNEPTVLI